MDIRRTGLVIAALGAVACAAGALLISGVIPMPAKAPLSLTASIGGPFELTDQNGQRFGSRNLAGKPFAIFFGFTQCPDICPTTLLEVSNDLAALGPKGDALRMVFVSVDERDTAEHLKAYLKSFDPRIVGLTGTPEEIVQITRAYRVFHQKVPTSSGYTINHTATVYLMGADGHLVGTLNFQEPHETQMRKLKRLVGD